MRTFDAIVLGGGLTGLSGALQLQARGWRCLVLDRAGPGEEASRANAGILGCDAFVRPDLPLTAGDVLLRLLRPGGATRIDPRALASLIPFLKVAGDVAAPRAVAAAARALAPLQAAAIGEHLALARAASALRFFRRTGWVKLYRRPASFQASEQDRHFARILGVPYAALSGDDLGDIEPDLVRSELAAISWPDSQSVSSPGGVAKAYARLFRERGGAVETGNAATLVRIRSGWAVRGARGEARAPVVVAALGAATPDILGPLGVSLPVAALRGYHRHFRAVQGVRLSRPVTDVDGGFTLTPMERGVRLVGGHELTRPDAPLRETALERAERAARALFPLGARVEDRPIPAVRACLPDGLPVIGAVPDLPGLWLAVPHARDGFALAPALGRLLAETMTGARPFADPAPFAPTRFL